MTQPITELTDRMREIFGLVVDAYLEVWSDLADPATLRAAVDPARQLGRINRSESWRRVLQSADATELAEFGDSQAHWLSTLLWHPTFQT